jgi:hypothetical protein
MKRKTKKINNHYVVDEIINRDENGYSGEAIELLAKFENYYEDLVSRQEAIIKEMDKLKAENKTNTVKFKQLFANKLNNSANLLILKQFGIH